MEPSFIYRSKQSCGSGDDDSPLPFFPDDFCLSPEGLMRISFCPLLGNQLESLIDVTVLEEGDDRRYDSHTPRGTCRAVDEDPLSIFHFFKRCGDCLIERFAIISGPIHHRDARTFNARLNTSVRTRMSE